MDSSVYGWNEAVWKETEMKRMMIMVGVVGGVLLLGGLGMVLISKGSAQLQIGGLVMMICAVPAIMEVRFLKIEEKIRKLEGKPIE
jgi:hypothetical protein